MPGILDKSILTLWLYATDYNTAGAFLYDNY